MFGRKKIEELESRIQQLEQQMSALKTQVPYEGTIHKWRGTLGYGYYVPEKGTLHHAVAPDTMIELILKHLKLKPKFNKGKEVTITAKSGAEITTKTKDVLTLVRSK